MDAIRVSNFGGLKKIEQYYPEILGGYVDAGIEKNSEDLKKASELLKNNGLPQNILIDHELNTDYVRIVVANKDHIDSLALHHQIVNNGQSSFIEIPLTDIQKSVIKSIYELYKNDNNIKQQNVKKIMEEWNNDVVGFGWTKLV